MWADVVVAVSSGVVALAALYALMTWRKQMTGKAKFDAARNVAFLAQKVNEDFKWARFPLASSAEAVGRPKRANESPNETHVLDEWYIRGHRIEILREDLLKLQAAGWEAEIVLGDRASRSITETISIYKKSFGELASSVNSYFEVKLQQAQGYAENVDPEWLTGLGHTVYSTQDDDFSTHLEKATDHLKISLRTHVR